MPIQQMLLASGAGGMTLLGAIQSAGLTSNLVLCLDSGDAVSYTSGQSWLDRAGSGYDFFLGATGGAEASDPTFTGTAGNLSAYWALDGGDYFTYDTTNEAWMQNIHKDNANFTILSVCYRGTAGAGVTSVVGTSAGNANTGFFYSTSGVDGTPFFRVKNAGADAIAKGGLTELTASAYNITAVSLNEATGAGGGFHWLNGAYNQVSGPSDTFDSTYTSPASGNATFTMQIAALGNAGSPSQSGDRMACVAVWTTALTKAQLDSLYALLRGRFGL